MRAPSAWRAPVVAALVVLCASFVVGGTTPARAADLFAPFTLSWNAPEGCPDGASVEAETTRLLRGFVPTGDAPLQARATVDHPAEKVWRLRLQTGTDGAERVVQAATCRELADAAAFILAAAVDPNSGDDAAETSKKGATDKTPPAPPAEPLPPIPQVDPHEVPPKEPPPRAPRPYAASETPFAVFAAVWIDDGLLPVGAVAPAAGFEYRPQRLVVLDASLGYFPHAHASTEGNADFSLGAGDVRVGYVIGPGRLEATVISGLELDWLHGAGDGGLAAGTGGTAFLSALIGWRLRFELVPEWAVRLEVDGVIPIERPLFILDPATIVHEPSVFGGRTSFGVERRF
jgi:hypothetical protein